MFAAARAAVEKRIVALEQQREALLQMARLAAAGATKPGSSIAASLTGTNASAFSAMDGASTAHAVGDLLSNIED